MSPIGYAFAIAGITCCCLLSLLLWCFSNKDEFQQKLLSIIFLTIGWYAFMYLLVSKGWITWCPFLFRLGMPFYYLVPPFALFYTQLLLKERSTIFFKTFLLHSLPFLLGFTDLVCYYIKNQGKLQYIAEQVLLDPVNSYIIGSGFIPAWTHYLFRPIHGCFYLILIGISFFKALKLTRLKNVNKQALRLLFILDGFLALNYTSTFYTSFIKPTNSFPILETSIIFAFTIVACFFIMSIKPFFSPYIIYRNKEGIDAMLAQQPTPSSEEINLKRNQSILDDHKASIKKKASLSNERVLEIASAMDHAISEQQLFKKLSKIGDLADYLNLSPRYLSYVLNKHYELNFNDYINYFRINYIILLMESAQYKNLTLEAMAKEAGFSSRLTFFIAFKKQTGLSPTQYLHRYRP
ncbi:MAG TPA: helix-turn-helix domain-containing protein [Pseudosphingobacterium sp.]|nr:helix-turn-helix domain-containing protein [Pseudosphingobacterium sp.]